MLLAHPEAEDLGRFVEGTLDDPERAAIVDHIADCDDCRMLVVDASEFVEPAAAHAPRNRWMAVAAAMILVALGTITFNHYRDPLAKTTQAYGQLKNRPFEARLSDFPYVPRVTMRGSGDEDDIPLLILQGEAATVAELDGNSAKKLHARGVGLLIAEKTDDAVSLLQKAVAKEPENPRYLNDLAVALIVKGSRDLRKPPENANRHTIVKPAEYVPLEQPPNDQPSLRRAITICDEVIRINPPSPEGLFNRAKALELLGSRDEVLKAYVRYLAVDSSSGWADEIRRSRDLLLSSPPSA
ncbi:MAG TPA: zf-HC2 domain-containing protein [Thermoanaerobaculia bacterium]|jgi:tetratricopeptide (TPR) repeat protein|nr:zf-HC2 domain-containing protein [Thermoanaerobaculia bacterium]